MDRIERGLNAARRERQSFTVLPDRADETLGGLFAGLRVADHGEGSGGLVLVLRIINEGDRSIEVKEGQSIEVRALMML